MRRLLLLLFLFSLAGCRAVVEAPAEVEPRATYQAIANALPEADFGFGSPPGIAEMSASAKAEGPAPKLEPLKATERGFRIRYQVFRVRNLWVPYRAIKQVSVGWEPMPNVLFAALIIMPAQVQRVTVVLDGQQVEGLLDRIERDAARLESISREIGLGGPWAHAQQVRAKLEDDAFLYGAGSVALHFDYVVGVPAWIPYGGRAEEAAEAFAWAAANHDAPELPDEEEPAPADPQ